MRFLALLLATVCVSLSAAEEPRWIPLFDGKTLNGWTIKITKHPLGENFANTFRVEDGILKVSYDDYETFDDQYGHLYTNATYSHYRFRLEYRFTGTMMPDAPHYVNLNSGFMVHSQSPLSLRMDQKFPSSLELQFLADAGKGPRPTGNLCTPGTQVEQDGVVKTQHILKSSAPTFPADEWVRAEIEVHGNDLLIHRINGVEVLRYEKPQLDPECHIAPASDLTDAGAALQLDHGHIALQAEGQPVWFRNIEILPLTKD